VPVGFNGEVLGSQTNVTITRLKGGEGIVISVGPCQSWPLIRRRCAQILTAVAVLALMTAGLVDALHEFLPSTRAAPLWSIWLAFFALAFVAAAFAEVRRLFARTTIQITGSDLSIQVSWPVGDATNRRWRRDAIYEVRRGDSRGEESGGREKLQVRVWRSRPFCFLVGREPAVLDAVGAAINAALLELPIATFSDDTGNTLTYATPGEPYEIEITPMSQGVRVVVPREADQVSTSGDGSQFLTTLMIVIGAWLIVCLLRPLLPHVRSPLIVFVGVVPAAVIQMVVTSFLRRGRRGQPLVVTVMGDDVLIDHPGLLKPRRVLRRDSITDVSIVDPDRGRSSARYTRAVRMTFLDGAGAPGSCGTITFCRFRDEIEQTRVVTALREAVGLSVDPGRQFDAELRLAPPVARRGVAA
jgi:hypothetical protein